MLRIIAGFLNLLSLALSHSRGDKGAGKEVQ
jgi:hypothetical protein